MTDKLRSLEQLRKEYIESECEEMEGESDRFSVYENDGDLVADWWLNKLTTDRAHIAAALIEGLEAQMYEEDEFLPKELLQYNRAINDAIALICTTLDVTSEEE